MTASWVVVIAIEAGLFVVINLLFASAYLRGGGVHNLHPGRFWDALFFSIQTMATVGSGTMSAISPLANALVSAEALIGLIGFAVATGLAIAKFSRPTARVRFSRFAVVSDRDGVPCLMFRVANLRENQILEARIHVVMVRSEVTREGERVRRSYDLALKRSEHPLFALSWTVVHPIEKGSPLLDAAPEDLSRGHTAIVASLIGTDETLLQAVPARHTYLPKDILFRRRLADILIPAGDESKWILDSSRFDDVVEAPLTLSSMNTHATRSLGCVPYAVEFERSSGD